MKHFQWLTERRVEKNACFRVAGVKLRLEVRSIRHGWAAKTYLKPWDGPIFFPEQERSCSGRQIAEKHMSSGNKLKI